MLFFAFVGFGILNEQIVMLSVYIDKCSFLKLKRINKLN